ncbi:MAG: DnaJ domain-containing protein [Deltaproteobacteria bacterium]|nr:DnaJ domain-containing protein [Deltaproteobacteria bacterium]
MNAPDDREKDLIPCLRKGIDLSRLSLTVEEGFVASRVDGRTRMSDLAHVVGKSPATVRRILERLSGVGVLVLDTRDLDEEADDEDGSPPDDDEGPYARFIFPPTLMQEDCELSVEERKRIIWFHEQMDTISHYELLQVRRLDDAKAIKAAYFERSKEWHPDRFRQRHLGTFKGLVEAIFQRVQTAYQDLSDPKRRAVYDKTVVFMPDEDEISEMLRRQRRVEREALRAQEAVDRRRKHNPVRKRLIQARRFFEQAQEQQASGDLAGALSTIRMAIAFDPRDEFRDLETALTSLVGELKLGPLMKRGLHHESLTNWSEAIEVFSTAVELAPENGEARLRLAYNLLMGGREPHEANPHVHKAVQLRPNEPEAHFLLGLCYEKSGMEKAAVRAYGRAVELKSNYAEAKKRLKRLRWGF